MKKPAGCGLFQREHQEANFRLVLKVNSKFHRGGFVSSRFSAPWGIYIVHPYLLAFFDALFIKY